MFKIKCRDLRRSFKKNICFCVMAAFTVCFMTACSQQTVEEKTRISIPLYEKKEYSAVEAQRGDLEPELNINVHISGLKKTTYGIEDEEMELKKLYVSVGEQIKKGDVLLTFQSWDMEETIKEMKKQLSDDQVLMEHYKRMQALEEKADTGNAEEVMQSAQSEYSVSIRDLKKEMEILKVRIAEAQEKLKGYSIVAEESGTVSDIDEYLLNGYVVPNLALITVAEGSGHYDAVVKDDYEFKIGDVYTAVNGIAQYELKLASIEEGPGEGERTLLFDPVSDLSGAPEAYSFTITLKKEPLNDVVYVLSKCIEEVEGKYYVFVLDENGYRDAVEVTLGPVVGEGNEEVTVITSGLTGGEQVMIR